ncbi:MAG: HDIG domain-containing protein [Tissierellia bacterium]|nr:HDIG domain-containing protein [Tissierellia bacterium]
MSYIPTRIDAEELFLQYNKSDALYKHAKQVEVVLKHFANKYGEDEEKWRVIGFLHDLDYEKYPEEHCKMTEEILKENNYPEEYINAIISHGYGICTDVEPKSQMEKILYATDELTGLINATCLMRPSQSVLDLKLSSLNKKFKDKKFAAGVDRDIILRGAEMLGWSKEQLLEETIIALQENAEEAYLKGNL